MQIVSTFARSAGKTPRHPEHTPLAVNINIKKVNYWHRAHAISQSVPHADAKNTKIPHPSNVGEKIALKYQTAWAHLCFQS
jgi:hypothetical protein